MDLTISQLIGTLKSTFKIGKATLDASGVATARSITVPDKAGTLALTGDFAAPPALGNTTPNTVAATSVTASSFVGTTVTGAIKLPKGTTNERPATTDTAVGLLRGNSDTGYPEYYSQKFTAWLALGHDIPINTVAPAVTGTAQNREILSCTTGTWTGPGITYTYQWQHGTTNISAATSNTYTLTAAYIGETIRCIVTATNITAAVAANSNATSAVIANVPLAPTIGTAAVASSTSATVAFTAPDTGGSAITGYTATSTPGSITHTGASSPITVSGLTPNTAYTFTVTATNAIGTGAASAASNSITTLTTDLIGTAGTQGFGVGSYNGTLPSGFSALTGSADKTSANYGNYQYTDGSIMCWIPAFYYSLSGNTITIKGLDTYATESAANAAGYALHRAFYNGGSVKTGFFVDKYLCSNKSSIASSVVNGNPLSSAAAHNPFAGLTGTPANDLSGAYAAVKTRGTAFFPMSVFIHGALAMLSVAHGQAASADTYCAWYDSNGVINFPKGCTNDALKDVNDTSVTFTTDGYLNCAKTGSGSNLAKTAHNGQTCGVVDLNGLIYEVVIGFASNGTNYYMLKTACDISTLTGANSGSTGAWGATSYSANYDDMGTSFGTLTGSSGAYFGNSTNQVLDGATSGAAWQQTGAGVPKLNGTGETGTNLFGLDYLGEAKPNAMCPVVGGSWGIGADAGVWALDLYGSRSGWYTDYGVRAALY